MYRRESVLGGGLPGRGVSCDFGFPHSPWGPLRAHESQWMDLPCMPPPPTAEGIRTAGVQGTHGSDLEQPLPQVITAGSLRMTQERGGGGL